MDVLDRFTTVADLDHLDDVMEEMSTKREQMVQRANATTTRTHTTIGQQQSNINSAVLEEISNEFILVVRQICSSHDLHILSEARNTYGDIAVFRQLDTLLADKVQAENDIVTLSKALEIENLILQLHDYDDDDDVDVVSKYAEVYRKVQSLTKSDTVTYLLLKWNTKAKALKTRLQSELTLKLDAVQWLSKESNSSISKGMGTQDIMTLTLQLVQLQAIEGVPQYPETWWALDTLVTPFTIRFNHNFNSNKPTNKISKPEWPLTFVEEFLAQHVEYIQLVLGNLVFESYHRITMYEIISAFLKPVRQKMKNMADSIVVLIELRPEKNNNRLLIHLIFELVRFDQVLRSSYLYNPFVDLRNKVPIQEWKGLAGDILAGCVEPWLTFEETWSSRRFNEIFSNENAWNIDVDFLGDIKPTFSAYDMGKLFEILTIHHQTLSILKYQLKFVLRVQLGLLDRYADELTSQHKKITLKSVRSFIPGNMDQKETDQTPYLLKLCEVFCLARYINFKMESWNAELIFAQLWKSFIAISGEQDEKSFFDTYKVRLNKILKQTKQNIVDLIFNEVRLYLKEYVNLSEWDIVTTHEVTPSVHVLTTKLPILLHQLQRHLSKTDYFIIAGEAVTAIGSVLREFVITNNRFSRAGREQLQLDCNYIWQAFSELLFLNEDSEGSSKKSRILLSHLDNLEYLKTQQSTELLVSVNEAEVKMFLEQNTYGLLRERTPGGFDRLHNGDIFDLLHRVLK